MAKNISALTGIKPWHSHDPLDGYLRDRLGVGVDAVKRLLIGHEGSASLQSSAGAPDASSSVDYGGFLRATRDYAVAESGQEFRKDVFVTRSLPSPNLLTFLYGTLNVPRRHQRHMREAAGQTAMKILANLDAGPDRLVELNYLRPGRNEIRPDARILLYPDPGEEGVVNLWTNGPLLGEGNIADVPGVHDVLTSDVRLVALGILTAYGIEQPV